MPRERRRATGRRTHRTSHPASRRNDAMKRHLDKLIQALVFVRLGQQLGTDSELAQAVAHGIDLLVSTLARFLG